MSLRQNALALAALTAIIAILGAWSGAPELSRAWCLPAGLLLLGLAYEYWYVQRTELTLSVGDVERGVLGRATTARWSWQHIAKRVLRIQFAPVAPAWFAWSAEIQELSLPPQRGATFELVVTPRQLGDHRWPTCRTRVAGPIGLAWWPRKIDPGISTRVVPDVLASADQRLGAANVGRFARRRLGSGSEILQLRQYQPGDELHRIDWKATARSRKLISRDFVEDQHLEVVLAIDAGRASQMRTGQLDRLGCYVNVAARFAEYAVAHDDRVGLVLFADRPLAVLPPMRGHAAVQRVRELLTNARVAPAESNPLSAAVRISTLVKHRSLIVILTDLDDATVAGQLAAAVRLLMPKHLPLIAGLLSPDAESLATQEAAGWLDPYHSLAAAEYSLRLGRNVAALTALGAPALVAHPVNLEPAVFAAYRDFRLRRRV